MGLRIFIAVESTDVEGTYLVDYVYQHRFPPLEAPDRLPEKDAILDSVPYHHFHYRFEAREDDLTPFVFTEGDDHYFVLVSVKNVPTRDEALGRNTRGIVRG